MLTIAIAILAVASVAVLVLGILMTLEARQQDRRYDNAIRDRLSESD